MVHNQALHTELGTRHKSNLKIRLNDVMWHGVHPHVRNVVEQVFLVRVKLKQEHERGFAVLVFIYDFLLFFSYF